MNCDNLGKFTRLLELNVFHELHVQILIPSIAQIFFFQTCPISMHKIIYDNHCIAYNPLSYIKT